jgi:flavin-dependent dehydrogenase
LAGVKRMPSFCLGCADVDALLAERGLTRAHVDEWIRHTGGPSRARLATAIAARAKNLRVIVADDRRPPLDKACGECLMPDALVALARLSIEIEPGFGYPFRGIRFLDGGDVAVEAAFPLGRGLGIRRTVRHDLLLRRAEQVGVEFLGGRPLADASGGWANLGSVRVRYRWLVGADDGTSSVRVWNGFARVVKADMRYGFRHHFRTRPWSDHVETYWGRKRQISVTPVADDEICIAPVSRNPHDRLDRIIGEFPNLARRLDDAVASDVRERGSLTGSRRLARAALGDVALIGDASGSADAITGRGMGFAFEQALRLADAMAAADLDAYADEHRSLMRRPLLMAQLMVALGDDPRLCRLALWATSSWPAAFAALLAFHLGEHPLMNVAAHVLRPFGRRARPPVERTTLG